MSLVPTDVQWQPFFWATLSVDSLVFPRAAVVIADARAPDAAGDSMLQLELGASGNWPLGFPAPSPDERGLASDIRLHGLLSRLQPVGLTRGTRGPAPPDSMRRLGTLGLPSFAFDLLFLDFITERLGRAPNRRDPAGPGWPDTRVVSIEYAGYQVIVPIGGGNVQPLRALLDSGLSPFPLWTSGPLWQQLTGRHGGDPRNRRYVIPHPAGTLVFVGAPTQLPVTLGVVRLHDIEAVFLESVSETAEVASWPFAFDAVLGPSALAGRVALALDLRRKRLLVSDRAFR